MKICTDCGRENEDQATKCQECGSEFARDRASTEDITEESGETERFEKIAVLDNEVQAELMDGVLSDRKIPHIMQSYHDSALDGLFQAGKGWGAVLAPESFKEEILADLADIKRQSESVSEDTEGASS
jgi:DNA-directed RNA polymerase subunit RPC12/RpoP